MLKRGPEVSGVMIVVVPMLTGDFFFIMSSIHIVKYTLYSACLCVCNEYDRSISNQRHVHGCDFSS